MTMQDEFLANSSTSLPLWCKAKHCSSRACVCPCVAPPWKVLGQALQTRYFCQPSFLEKTIVICDKHKASAVLVVSAGVVATAPPSVATRSGSGGQMLAHRLIAGRPYRASHRCQSTAICSGHAGDPPAKAKATKCNPHSSQTLS